MLDGSLGELGVSYFWFHELVMKARRVVDPRYDLTAKKTITEHEAKEGQTLTVFKHLHQVSPTLKL